MLLFEVTQMVTCCLVTMAHIASGLHVFHVIKREGSNLCSQGLIFFVRSIIRIIEGDRAWLLTRSLADLSIWLEAN